ncbi:MAG TPA: secretin N-terminal domain-containing protein, partial [Phycisphaerae bacterium]|nr:secretin N-terminal domain-containing protein [Phycisphaerae bacterium]
RDDPRPAAFTVTLKNSKASDIQNILRQIYPVTLPGGANPGRAPQVGVDPKADLAKRIDIIPDNKNNALIIRGPERVMSEMTELIAKLDSGPGLPPTEMRVIKLEHADPNQLATTLKQIVQKQQMDIRNDPTINVPPERKAAANWDAFSDMANGAVILMGTKEGLDAAEKLVRDMDKPDENTQSQIVELKKADAANLVTMLTQMFPPQSKPGQLPPRITARTSNTILLSAGRAEFDRIKDVIEKLDVENDEEARQHLVKLNGALPSVMANTLTQAASGLVPPKSPIPGRPQAQGQVPGSSMRFVPDDASGFLIVYCSDREWEKLEPLIKQLDEQSQLGEARLTIVPLKNADAADMVASLKSMFPAAPQQPGKQGPVAQTLFNADTFNNAVQIFAPAEFTKKAQSLIAQLDIVTSGPLHVIKLVNAKAETIAPIIGQAMQGASTAGPAGMPQVNANRGPTPGGVRVVAEPITNSLLVTASPKDLAQIEKLVTEMESKSQTARVILEVKNRSSTEIAEVLKTLSGQSSAAGALKAPGAPSVNVGGLTILANGKTIILDGPQEQVAKCIQLFDQLDVPYDQPLFRKYKVQDAEEDEKKLRSMLALAPASVSSTSATKTSAHGPAGGGAPTPAAGPSLAAPDAITIYADTAENALIVGVKVESDFAIVEKCLEDMFSDPRLVKKRGPNGEMVPIEDSSDFVLVPLKYKEGYDVAYDIEKLLNPDNKSGGVRVDEGPNKKSLLVRNLKPAQKDKLTNLVAMFDVPKGGSHPNRRILTPKLIPGGQLARIIAARYPEMTGNKVKVLGTTDEGPVRTIDIHADEAPATTTQSAPRNSISPCVLPVSLIRSLAELSVAQAAAQPIHDPATCPVCRQNACALPGGVVASLNALIHASFDDPIYDEPKTQAAEGANHVIQPQTESKTATAETPPADSQPVTVIVDPDTQVITLLGSDEAMSDLEDWVDDLINSDAPPTVVQFPLRYADVTTAGQLLEQVFNQGGVGQKKGRGAAAAPLPMAPMAPQPGKAGVPGQPVQPGQPGQPGQPQQPQQPQAPGVLKAIPDPRTKSLLVVAPPQMIPLVTDVLKKIDQSITAIKDIRIFKLTSLDATQVVQNLREVLGLDQGAARGARPARPGMPGQPGAGGEQPGQQVFQMPGQPGAPGAPGQPGTQTTVSA